MAKTSGSLTEFAALMGVSKPYVAQLRKAGRLVLVEDGTHPVVDFTRSRRRIKDTEQIGKANNGANAGGRGRQDAAAAGQEADSASERVGALYRQSQAQHKAYQARSTELEWRRRSGLLVEKAIVDAVVTEAFRALQLAVMDAPKRAAPAVLGLTEVREVQELFEAELRLSFEDFARAVSAPPLKLALQ